MRISNEKFDLKDKDKLVAKFGVKPIRNVKGINETVDSVYVSNKGDILYFGIYRHCHIYTYTYVSHDEISKFTDRWGYPVVCIQHIDLDDKYKRKLLKLHRLVACTWIENPHNLRDVDHIDGNKLNNSADNLEWVSHAENCKRYWDKHVRDSSRLYIECCNRNMLVVQTVNVDDYKFRYRKCKYCGRRVITRQDVGKNEVIVREY